MSSEDLYEVSSVRVPWWPVLLLYTPTGLPCCVSVVGFGQLCVATWEGGKVVVFW